MNVRTLPYLRAFGSPGGLGSLNIGFRWGVRYDGSSGCSTCSGTSVVWLRGPTLLSLKGSEVWALVLEVVCNGIKMALQTFQ